MNLPPGSSAAIMLQSKDFNLVLSGAEMHKDGSFEIRDVSPGTYTIVATVDNVAVPMVARQSLQLAESVDGVRLSPQSGGTVRGRLHMESSASGSARPDPSQFFLLLHSAAEDTDGNDESLGSVAMGGGFSNLAHVGGDGSFAWKDVPPGTYFVQISEVSATPDWFLKSVASDGHDANDTGFSVGGGAISLDLVATANGGSIDGAVGNQDDEPVADAVIVAAPEAHFRNRPDRYRKALADQSGHFSLRGLPPGDYTLFAWESVEGDAYYNPDFLRSYEDRGKAMHVRAGDRLNVQLKAIPPEDQP